ncbi:bifunctional phosphoribosyl-AMP cyclohydrolase/phosphoribosyl-ATP diphosphatase HisIE [Bacillus andreraoultii]|uniref:bifunctional phosphoribosyl-AMP cyclohydrolase/phosphoribosyl-ATP diphosphatase HisIE n=1 Tax=Bacillus andreraoultii TaxID=1499685 RepID=UPI00053ADE2A|nr:bifunctional phosphoribosyl-AMP cyclohydrolase/phosphoribosyl-ATP diphosphatase HisIE [Bacillus andreraoultii]
MNVDLNQIKFDEKGLVPTIVQDCYTGKVLMLAYMNKESLLKTVESGTTWFYSRSRMELWNKGATSGHYQYVKRMTYDCDGDSILVEVEQVDVACHTGEESCFHNTFFTDESFINYHREIVNELYTFLQNRKTNPVEGSYTNYLFEKGLDKILKKIGEETTEVIIEAKNLDKTELVAELSDLIYHSLLLMIEKDIQIVDLKKELMKRMETKQQKGKDKVLPM